MKRIMTRILTLVLCFALCFAMSVPTLAAGSSITVTAGDVSYSESAQTVTVTIAINPGASITAFSGNISVPEDWSVNGKIKVIGTDSDGDPTTEKADVVSTNNNSFAGVKQAGMTATSIEISYNVPAKATGTVTLGAVNLILSKDGANQLEGSNDGIAATTTVSITAPAPTTGYGVALSASADSVTKNSSVDVYLDVTNSSETTFNAFYAVLTYSNSLVSYSGGDTVSGFTVDSTTAGTLKISKTGADVTIGDSHELTLPFTANAAGSASFALTSANVDKAANAETQNAPAAIVTGSPQTVTVTETNAYSVSITLGANMTSSGSDLSQTGLTGAMTDVVVTPDTGYSLAAPTISPANAGITATLDSATGAYTISGTPTADVTVTFAAATVKAPTATTSTYFTGYTLIAATIEADGYVPTYNGNAMFKVSGTGYDANTYYYVVDNYDATKLGSVAGTAETVTKSADVNQTGTTDINDAQFVYNIYNGAAPTANIVQRLLLADVNGDKTVTVADCAAVVTAIG